MNANAICYTPASCNNYPVPAQTQFLISSNGYYGYDNIKNHTESIIQPINSNDCEMTSISPHATVLQHNARKRSGEVYYAPSNKRPRNEPSSKCSRVGTLSSPSHSASAFKINVRLQILLCFSVEFVYD